MKRRGEKGRKAKQDPSLQGGYPGNLKRLHHIMSPLGIYSASGSSLGWFIKFRQVAVLLKAAMKYGKR